jgi:hypothetical protein
MTFKTAFYAMNLDVAGYSKTLLKYLRSINEKAGQAWIDTAVNKTPIPTWSGASRATFVKLASELGTSVPIGPIRPKKDRTNLGRATSARSTVIEDPPKGYAGFVYATSLRYLAYNEYNLATAGPPPQPFSDHVRFTPYNFQSRAQTAWLKVAVKAKLPNPLKHLKKRKI